MPAAIRREFGITDDTVAGGSQYDVLPSATPKDATVMWPVTGGNLDRGLDRIDRSSEVRGRRAVTAPLPFRAAPMMTIPGPAYRSIVEKLLKKTLGGVDSPSGSAGAGYTHTLTELGFGSVQLPAMHCQLIRDDLNHKMSGGMVNRVALSFPLDGEGTFETDVMGLYYNNFSSAAPTATYTDVDNVLMLRDAYAVLDGSTSAVSAQQTITSTATGGTWSATFMGQTASGLANTITGAALVTALTGLSTIGAGGVTATGGPLNTTPIVLTFAAGLAAQPVQLIAIDNALATGGTVTAVMTTAGGYGTLIPDLVGIDFSFTNNLDRKWYPLRNRVRQTLGSGSNQALRTLWFPAEYKLGGQADITYGLTFGNTNTAQDVAIDFAQLQSLVFVIQGGAISGTSPVQYEQLVVRLATVEPGGGAGPEALQARGDITYRVEGGGFYNPTDGYDVQVQVLNGISSALT